MCCFPSLFHFVERIRGGRSRAGNEASLALLVFMRGLFNTLRANLHDTLLMPVDQMLMHGMDSKDVRTRFRTYGFSVPDASGVSAQHLFDPSEILLGEIERKDQFFPPPKRISEVIPIRLLREFRDRRSLFPPGKNLGWRQCWL